MVAARVALVLVDNLPDSIILSRDGKEALAKRSPLLQHGRPYFRLLAGMTRALSL